MHREDTIKFLKEIEVKVSDSDLEKLIRLSGEMFTDMDSSDVKYIILTVANIFCN